MSLSSSFKSCILFSGTMRSEVRLLKKLCDKSSVFNLDKWVSEALDTATIRLLAKSKWVSVGAALNPWSSSTSIWLWFNDSEITASRPAKEPRRTLLNWLWANDSTFKWGNRGRVLGPNCPTKRFELKSSSSNDRSPCRWDVDAEVSMLFWSRKTFKNGRFTKASWLM